MHHIKARPRRTLAVLIAATLVALLCAVSACGDDGGGGGGYLSGTGCLADSDCASGLRCMPIRGGGMGNRCLKRCNSNSDCSGVLDASGYAWSACWMCSTDTTAWHCITPETASCSAIRAFDAGL